MTTDCQAIGHNSGHTPRRVDDENGSTELVEVHLKTSNEIIFSVKLR